MRWNVMLIVSRCWDGVMREDEAAQVTWPGIVMPVYAAHTAGRATHCYVSYLLHTSDRSLLTLHTPCLRVSRVSTQSHDTPAHTTHILLCPDSPDAIYAFLGPALSSQASR